MKRSPSPSTSSQPEADTETKKPRVETEVGTVDAAVVAEMMKAANAISEAAFLTPKAAEAVAYAGLTLDVLDSVKRVAPDADIYTSRKITGNLTATEAAAEVMKAASALDEAVRATSEDAAKEPEYTALARVVIECARKISADAAAVQATVVQPVAA